MPTSIARGGVGVSRESTDGAGGGSEKVKRKKKRPLSGYELPEVKSVSDLVGDLGHEDDR